MRRKTVVFILAQVLILGFLIHLFWPLICLLFLTGEEDRITRAEIEEGDSSPHKNRKDEVIPRIIHQTWITCPVPDLLSGSCTTKPLPEKWRDAYMSVREVHKGWNYTLWEDLNSREFIEREYPWFLPTWDSYPYPIQRADAIRYFVIYHYGGIYIDLDDGSLRPLTPLLTIPCWVRRTTPTGIGNDVIASVPHHPFLERAIKSLERYNLRWPTPYITIMSSTGPLYFSILWRQHNKNRRHMAEDERVRLLWPDEYMEKDLSFFSHHEGNSWHQWDAELMFWMLSHWMELTILGFITAFAVIFGIWWLSNCGSRRRRKASSSGSSMACTYTPIKQQENVD